MMRNRTHPQFAFQDHSVLSQFPVQEYFEHLQFRRQFRSVHRQEPDLMHFERQQPIEEERHK